MNKRNVKCPEVGILKPWIIRGINNAKLGVALVKNIDKIIEEIASRDCKNL